MRKPRLLVYGWIALCAVLCTMCVLTPGASASENGQVPCTGQKGSPLATNATQDKVFWGYIAIAAGIAIGLTGLATSIAQQSIGAAAVGAMAEDPKFFGKGLILVALPETIVIFGLVIAILLWLKME